MTSYLYASQIMFKNVKNVNPECHYDILSPRDPDKSGFCDPEDTPRRKWCHEDRKLVKIRIDAIAE